MTVILIGKGDFSEVGDVPRIHMTMVHRAYQAKPLMAGTVPSPLLQIFRRMSEIRDLRRPSRDQHCVGNRALREQDGAAFCDGRSNNVERLRIQ